MTNAIDWLDLWETPLWIVRHLAPVLQSNRYVEMSAKYFASVKPGRNSGFTLNQSSENYEHEGMIYPGHAACFVSWAEGGSDFKIEAGCFFVVDSLGRIIDLLHIEDFPTD